MFDHTVQRVPVTDILNLRHRVLRTKLPISTAHFPGDEDATTWHFAIFDSLQAVCCASFMLNEYEGESAWQLRGMATDPSYQGHGLGRELLTFAVGTLAKAGPRLFWCNAREIAIPFYERSGWECVSDLFDIPTAGPHRKMRFEVPEATDLDDATKERIRRIGNPG